MKTIKTKENVNRRMIYGLCFMIYFSFFACSEHESSPSESDRLACKSAVEGYSIASRALSDQIKDINFYYLESGQTTNYTTYPILTTDLVWLSEYFLFETDKWRSDINSGSIVDTTYYYLTATNETGASYIGNPTGIEPLQGIATMIGDPIAEFYLKCREAKLTTIVKMADGSKLDPSKLTLDLNVFPSDPTTETDFKAPAIKADKTQPLTTHSLITPEALSTQVASISRTILLPEQEFDVTADAAHRPTMLMEYDDTKYHVYLDTIALDRKVTDRYRAKYNGTFALLHNEHITLTLSLTPIIELVATVTLDDWQVGKSFEPIAVEPE